MVKLFIFVIFLCFFNGTIPRKLTEIKDVVFLIIDQPHKYHVMRSELFIDHLKNQVVGPDRNNLNIHKFTELFSEKSGAWTLLQTMSPIQKLFKDCLWFFICEEETRIDLLKFVTLLNTFDSSKKLFLGHELHDRQASIIHHFAFHENPSAFKFPDISAGLLLSMPLVEYVAEQFSTKKSPIDFSIDAKYEFAKFLWDNNSTDSVALQNVPEFCTTDKSSVTSSQCITHVSSDFPSCGQPISSNDLFVAVKTCSLFYGDRIPVVQNTWGKKVKHLRFYSDTSDASIPTVNLGIPNTERGHCAKTFAILNQTVSDSFLSTFPWILILDDDTIINIRRVRQLLRCYDADEPLIIAERYGYAVVKEAAHGYNYPTGGGGMIFSRAMLRRMFPNGAAVCRCPSIDSPDDMIIGVCAKSLGISIVHSPLFHQSIPGDYAADYLSHQKPISFHKHWSIDPIAVYNEWFSQTDLIDDHEEL